MSDSMKLKSISTFDDTTVVSYIIEAKNRADVYRPRIRQVAFRDVDNNQRLNAGDQKVEFFEGETLPQHYKDGFKKYPYLDDEFYRLSSVTKNDIRKYGKRTNRFFRMAKRHRSASLTLQALKDGAEPTSTRCMHMTNTSTDDIVDRPFIPKMTLSTNKHGKTEYTRKEIKLDEDLMKGTWHYPDTVDPAKCTRADAIGIPVAKSFSLKLGGIAGEYSTERNKRFGLSHTFNLVLGLNITIDDDRVLKAFNLESSECSVDMYYFLTRYRYVWDHSFYHDRREYLNPVMRHTDIDPDKGDTCKFHRSRTRKNEHPKK